MFAPVQPQISSVVAQAAAAATLFKPGQVLEALVLGKTPDGHVALRIGDIVVNAQLPQALPPGTTVQLQVKSGGLMPQLLVVGTPKLPAQPPAAAPLPPVPLVPVLQRSLTVVQAQIVVDGAPPTVPRPVSAVAPTAAPTASVAPANGSTPVLPTGAATPAPPPVAASRPAIAESFQPLARPAAPIASTGTNPVGSAFAPSPAAPPASPIAAAPSTAAAMPHVAPVPPGPGLPISAGPSSAAPVVGRATLANPPSPVQPMAASAPQPPAPPPSAQMPAPPAVPLPPVPTPPAGTITPAVAATPTRTVPAPRPTAPVAPSLATPTAPTTAVAPTATVAPPALLEPAAANPLLVAQGAVRPRATAADLPKSAPLLATVPAARPTPPPLPATPAAALAQMVPVAMAQQNSMAPLLAALAAITAKPGALPEPALRAALQVLGQRVQLPPTGPTAPQLEAAMAKSGVYLEAALARGAPAADLKSGLVALKGALTTWLGGNPAPVTPAQPVAPPLRGTPPRAESVDLPPPPDAPREAARALHSQADAALSRVKLMQLASLPDADPGRPAAPELRMEVPFLLGQELVMAQFQVMRDTARRKAEGKRGWTMRFAMNLPASGEVGAEVGLLGRSVNVALWAVDPETSARLEAALPELSPALAALGLEPGAVRIRNLPPEAPKPASGQYLDSRR